MSKTGPALRLAPVSGMESEHDISRAETYIGSPADESEAELIALGWKRPAIFPHLWNEVAFCFAVFVSIAMGEYFVSGFHTALPPISEALHISHAAATWPSSVFSLVAGALLLPAARLADMYGPRVVFVAGTVWFAAAALGGGFSSNYVVLVACRALQAVGIAGYAPTGIMLLGSIYRPGPRKNIVFGLYGALAPVGFFIGILFGGFTTQYLNWRWYFWIGSMISAAVAVVAVFSVPYMPPRSKDHPDGAASMDWWGVCTIVPGFVLFVFALTDCSTAPNGFATPYIIVTFIIGVLLLAAAVYVEGWVATDPLLPPALFRTKYMKVMCGALFLSYGTFGMFLFYSTFYIENILGVSPIVTAAYYVPMVVGGIVISGVGGVILHRLSGTVLLLISALGHVTCMLLFALLPLSGTLTVKYWAIVMPAMLAATIGIDITWTVTNVYITTALPARYQGNAGALIHSLLYIGIGVWLGLANLTVSYATTDKNLDLRNGYRVAFWMGVGTAALTFVAFCFVRVGRAKSELTADEKAAAEARAAASTSITLTTPAECDGDDEKRAEAMADSS